MAVDVRNFVSEPTSTEGLDRLSYNLQLKNQQKIRDQRDAQARETASTKFFANYLDDKEKFTGTQYDPITHQLLSSSLNDAIGLIRQGANDGDVLAAISPKVNRANEYTQRAQTYSANKKAYIDRLFKGGAKGIDLERLNSAIDQQAFPHGVDVSKVDPNINYGDMALKNGDVYNTEGFDEQFKNAPKNTETGVVKYTNKKGGMERDKVKLTAPYYAVSEKDADGNHVGFVPKYQIATDGGNDLIHTFKTEQGDVNAPVRLYDKELFNQMPPSEKGYLLQETRKYAKEHGVDLSSTQAENFARALAYDEKKSRINGTYEHIEDTKEAPAPRISIHVGSQSERKAAQSSNDLKEALDSEPTTDDGKINVSKYVNGVTFITNSKGKRISQPEVLFDPKQKTFTYTDDEGNPETVSFAKFKSIATPSNPQSDLSFLEGFRNYKRNANVQQQEPAKPVDETIKKDTKSFFQKVTNGIFGGGNKQTKKPEKDPLGLF